MPDSLQIQIDERDDGVSAETLRVQLDQAMRFLRDDPEAGEGVHWRVTRASMSSPLTLDLQRAIPGDAAEPSSRPGEQLARAFAQLARGEALGEDLSLDRLHALEKMASEANGVRRVSVMAGVGDRIVLDPEWAATVRKIRADRKSHGTPPDQLYSTVGRLEAVNVHGNKSEFYVYDPLTDQRMRCIFSDERLEEVGRALGARVEVSGITTFGSDHEPKSMRVDSLRQIPSRAGSFLDRLEEAHRRGGIDLAGGSSAEQALDEVRGGPS